MQRNECVQEIFRTLKEVNISKDILDIEDVRESKHQK